VRMLLWILSCLDPSSNPDDAILWFALVMAFMFLMRIREYAWSAGWDFNKVMTPSCIRLYSQGRTVARFEEAEELHYCWPSSKADQEGRGETRSHFRITDSPMCVIRAGELLQKHFGERFRNEPAAPLCRWVNGSPVTREQIQAVLERAAVAHGLPPERFRTHSLRIGGATALYHTLKDTETVKRWGRWKSGAFHSYLWDSREDSRGVGAAMASDQTVLHVG
jgi:hypothetical protein